MPVPLTAASHLTGALAGGAWNLNFGFWALGLVFWLLGFWDIGIDRSTFLENRPGDPKIKNECIPIARRSLIKGVSEPAVGLGVLEA